MSTALSNPIRRSLLALCGVLAAAAFAAPTASASITSVTITGNTIKNWDMFDYTDSDVDPLNDRTVSGTVDAGASVGDVVKVSCFDPISGSQIGNFGTANVTADKKWIITDTLYPIRSNYCRIVAVPYDVTSVSAGDLTSKYKGSKIATIGYFSRSYRGLGGVPHTIFTYDYEIEWPSKTMGYLQMYSFSSCGLCNSKLRKADGSTGVGLWGWNSSNYDGYSAFLTPPASGPDADPLMLVDGKLAMDPYMTYNRTSASRSAKRFGGINLNYSINQANGDLTITESQPLTRCVDVTDPSQWRSCSVVAPTGVRLDRVITVTADGAIWRSADTFVSADGKAHTVRASYVNYRYSEIGIRYGISGAYAASVKGDKSGNALGSVGKPYVVLGVKRDVSLPTVDIENPAGDIVMSPRPTLIRVLSDNDKYIYPRWALTVPAKGKSATVKQAYTNAASDARLTALRNTAIAGLAK